MMASPASGLRAYLPFTLRRMLAGASPADVPGLVRRVSGSVMFMDVSGFTPLSESLARRGREGSEELTRILNLYFESMIEALEAAGGDVCRFGGDAMTVLFEKPPEEDWRAHSLRVLSCAEELQRRMQNFRRIRSSMGGTFSLRMKIGAARGESFLACLGTPEEGMEYAFAGKAVDRCAEAEHHAQAGEIVADAGLREGAAMEASWEDRGGGFFALQSLRAEGGSGTKEEPGEPADETLALFLPPVLGDAARSGHEGWLNEHRRVAVLFLQFEAVRPAGNKNAAAQFGAIYGEARRVVSRHGGYINKLDMGDKGSKMLVLFGAPEAMEYAESAAMSAALELREALRRSGSLRNIKMGLNSGRLFCGIVGAGTRREYTVMGDAVNLAARLMTAAGDWQILLEGGMSRSGGGRFDVRAQSPIRVKGKGEPVPVALLEGIARDQEGAGRPAAGPVLVGREEEKRLLAGAVEEAASGHARALCLAGEAGMGKTALAAWTQERMRERGFRVFHVLCEQASAQVPYFVWAKTFESMLGLRGKPPREQAELFAAACRRLVPEEAPRWFLLAEMMGVTPPPGPRMHGLDERLRKENLREVCIALLRSFCAFGPAALRVENAHLMDSLSREMTRALMARLAGLPFLILETRRPAPDTGPPEGFSVLELGPLPPADFSRFVAALLGGEADEELLSRLEEKSRRNPFFAREVVQSLREAGAVERMASGRWRFASAAGQASIPDNIQRLLISRMDRLPVAARAALKAAACMGGHFHEKDLEDILAGEVPPGEMPRQMQVLRREGFVAESPVLPGQLLVANPMAQEAAYEAISFALRRRLHARIAGLLEKKHRHKRSEAPAALLALHYRHAGPNFMEKALRWSMEAGRLAEKQFAYREAAAHYRAGAELLRRARRKKERAERGAPAIHEALRRMARCYFRMGDYAAALAAYRKSAAAAKRANEQRDWGEILNEMAAAHIHQNSHAEAMRVLRLSRDMAARRRIGTVKAKALEHIADVETRTGKHGGAEKHLRQAIEIFRRSRLKSEEAVCRYYLTHLYFRMGRWKEALREAMRSQRLTDPRREKHLLVRCLIGRANVHRQMGQYAAAAACYRRAAATALQIGDKYAAAANFLNLAELHFRRLQFGEAEKCNRRALTYFEELGTGGGAAICLNNLGSIHLSRGEYEESLDCYTKAAGRHRASGSRSGKAASLCNAGEALLALGRWEEAGERFAESLKIQREIKSAEGQAYALAGLACTEWRRGREKEARRLAGEGLALAKSAQAHEPEGVLYRLLGEMNGGAALFKNSAAIFERDNNACQLALTLQAWGEWLKSRGRREEASACFGRALPLYEKLGNGGAAEKMRERLA